MAVGRYIIIAVLLIMLTSCTISGHSSTADSFSGHGHFHANSFEVRPLSIAFGGGIGGIYGEEEVGETSTIEYTTLFHLKLKAGYCIHQRVNLSLYYSRHFMRYEVTNGTGDTVDISGGDGASVSAFNIELNYFNGINRDGNIVRQYSGIGIMHPTSYRIGRDNHTVDSEVVVSLVLYGVEWRFGEHTRTPTTLIAEFLAYPMGVVSLMWGFTF